MLDYHQLITGPAVREAVEPLPEPPTVSGRPVSVAVRRLRGDRMTTRAALFDEFAAALQFPPYFGHNRDAFDECLRDVACPEGPDATVVLAVTEPEAVLTGADTERAWLLDALREANAVRAGRGSGRLVLLMARGAEGTSGEAWWPGER